MSETREVFWVLEEPRLSGWRPCEPPFRRRKEAVERAELFYRLRPELRLRVVRREVITRDALVQEWPPPPESGP